MQKPGKGQAVVRTKLYNLRNEKVWERTFKSGKTIESADISEKNFHFIYTQNQNYSLNFFQENLFLQVYL